MIAHHIQLTPETREFFREAFDDEPCYGIMEPVDQDSLTSGDEIMRIRSTETPTDGAESPKRDPKPTHPAIAEDTKLTELPADYDMDRHAPTLKRNWLKEEDFYEYRAVTHEHHAKKWRDRAEESKRMGTGADRAAKKRLTKMTAKVAELRASLEASGVDVDELLNQ